MSKLLHKKWITHHPEAKKQQIDPDASPRVYGSNPTQSPLE